MRFLRLGGILPWRRKQTQVRARCPQSTEKTGYRLSFSLFLLLLTTTISSCAKMTSAQGSWSLSVVLRRACSAPGIQPKYPSRTQSSAPSPDPRPQVCLPRFPGCPLILHHPGPHIPQSTSVCLCPWNIKTKPRGLSPSGI